jgi:hypothetical protein
MSSAYKSKDDTVVSSAKTKVFWAGHISRFYWSHGANVSRPIKYESRIGDLSSKPYYPL